MTAAARYYAEQLRRSPEARAYLASRGIALDTAMQLGLGYAPGRGLRAALASAGFAAGRIRESGLFAERGERFAGMVVRPVLGMGLLGPAPPWAVVAEGIFDWLVLSEWGLPACAALGTQGMERIAAALRGCPHVFLAFDQDDAGSEATARLAGQLGRRAAVVTLPEGIADVADLATKPEGRRVFLRLLERAARAAR